MRIAKHLHRLLLPSVLSAALCGGGPAAAQDPGAADVPPVLYFPDANSRPTYFTVHDVAEAWTLTRGAGVKVGILDHSFGFRVHPGLYAGGAVFQTDRWAESFDTVSHHGYWMARTLREVAPEVEIFALGTYSSDEAAKVDAMIRAIDWAIAHELDVLTYSAARFSPEQRARLDEAVDRALASGIATTFIHYPHPGNILPTWLGPRTGDDEREPDLNVLHYDYSVVFTERYAAWMREGEASGYRPFLSVSSTSPVTAAFVALVKSVRPELGPAELRRILVESSRPLEFQGHTAPRAVDVGAAVAAARASAGGAPGPVSGGHASDDRRRAPQALSPPPIGSKPL